MNHDTRPLLPIDHILSYGRGAPEDGVELGRSRRGRPIVGFRRGAGGRRVSLVAGAHADEPVGARTLELLAHHLGRLDADHPLLTAWSWWIVPDVNPDGAAANRSWSDRRITLPAGGEGYDLVPYLERAVREPPGDDVEFGYPRAPSDRGARPENVAVARFLATGAPFVLHGSLHSIAFATGPWFLLERSWRERTAPLRKRLTERVKAAGYRLHEVDRGGEKGFWPIAEGFTTRPDSASMRDHFLARGEPETAALFRPSSMELVRSWGGDPLTFVSEMPLFLIPPEPVAGAGEIPLPVDPRAKKAFTARVAAIRREAGPEKLHRHLERAGIRPMPLDDQIAFQLAFLDECMATVTGFPPTTAATPGEAPAEP